MNEKKKLFYIVRYQLDQPFNLKAKFDGQLRAFENLGFDVYYLAFDASNFYMVNNGQKTVVGKTHFRVPGYLHSMLYWNLYSLAGKMLNGYDFDIVYWRHAPCWYSSYRLAKQIQSARTRFIYEHPTYPIKKEKQMNLFRAAFMHYSNIWSTKIEACADAFALIGEDANGVYKSKPAVNISNGICLDLIPARQPKNDPDTIHILALASMSYWHGYDRLIRSLGAYTGDQKVQIHMVGGNDGGAVPEWKALVAELGLQDNVLFHGQKSGEALDDFFNLCDVGVNSLGMYRKGFSMTSELKSREYTGRGLPFICSVDDPDLLHTQEPLWLRVSNDDTIPDMQEIVDFALRMRADRNIVNKLRSYAQAHLTWEAQYQKVFDTIKV